MKDMEKILERLEKEGRTKIAECLLRDTTMLTKIAKQLLAMKETNHLEVCALWCRAGLVGEHLAELGLLAKIALEAFRETMPYEIRKKEARAAVKALELGKKAEARIEETILLEDAKHATVQGSS